MTNIVGIISLYNPVSLYCRNIMALSSMLDLIILLDDSETSQRHIVESVLSDKVLYEWNGSNIGLCKSINNGIKKALDMRADWIFIMDQDSCPENDIIQIYKNFIENTCTKYIASLVPQYNYDRHMRSSKNGIKYLEYSNLSGSLINAKLIKKIGLYDERFFIDGLDIEWSIRARRKGYQIVECSLAVLHHQPAETRVIRICKRILFRYGYSTCHRHYYQVKAGLLINGLYHDGGNIMMMAIKICKAILLYGNPYDYMRMTLYAFKDYRNKEYGRIRYL